MVIPNARIIPTTVKVQVWNRGRGRCVQCGSSENLHYDHDLPYSKGGTSYNANEVKILCAKCNLKKSSKIIMVSRPI
ncbi:MAG TPA: HNH endonuclease [Candidatus Kryptonia bacterium]